MYTVMEAGWGQGDILYLDILYLEGKSPLLMRNNQVNSGDILPETSKSSAF